jgi:phosphoadenosine phosphosulfate reductase
MELSSTQAANSAPTRPGQAPAMAAYAGWSTPDVLRDLLCRVFPGRIALVSSFGTESAVLLHSVSRIDRAAPVIFLETGKLFPETLRYRDMLVDRLGLSDVRSVRPDAGTLALADPAGTLWQSDPDVCCWHRKVEPLADALAGFPAWITGRKRFQGGMRGALPLIEREGDRVKVNALASWSADQLEQYMAEHGLPRHPLEAQGYRSLGCTPCTRPTAPGADPRAGRWAGRDKTECGIHLPPAPVPPAPARPIAALTETSSHA